MACISQLHVAVFLVPSTSSGAFKHVYVDDAWNVAPQSKRMFEWLILFSQNPLIDHVFLWYQYINQYLSTCFPHVGTNLVFFPGFNLLIYEPRIFIRPLERDRHGRKTHCLGYVVWICQGNDVWFSNMLVFYEGIHVWQSLKKKSKKTLKKKTYICHMWARFSDICQCQSVSCHFVCYFLCSSWMVSGCCFNGGPNTRQKRFCAWQRIPINWGSSWGETWWKCWCFLRWVDHLKWIYIYIYIWINWINVTCIIYNYIYGWPGWPW